MKVILLKDVKGVGRRFEEKSVADGYALNMLLPKKLAVVAGSASAAQVAELKRQGEAQRAKEGERLHAIVSKLSGQTLTMKIAANDQGHLFQKVTREKVAELAGLDEDCVGIEMPIKQTGTYEVPVEVGDGKKTSFTLIIERA